jgi:hypothetical protein
MHDMSLDFASFAEGCGICCDCFAWEAYALADRLHNSAGASSSSNCCEGRGVQLPTVGSGVFTAAAVVAHCLGRLGGAIRAAGVGGGSSRFQLCSHFGGSWAWRSRHWFTM